MKKIISIIFIVQTIFFVAHTFAQDSCESITSQKIKVAIVNVIGKDSFKGFFEEKQTQVIFKITTDSLGRVIDFNIIKGHDNFSSIQMKAITCNLKSIQFCLVNPDPHYSSEQYRELKINKFSFLFNTKSFFIYK